MANFIEKAVRRIGSKVSAGIGAGLSKRMNGEEDGDFDLNYDPKPRKDEYGKNEKVVTTTQAPARDPFDVYAERILNKYGSRTLGGKSAKAGFTWRSGPLKGMTKAQATEKLRENWGKMTPEQQAGFVEAPETQTQTQVKTTEPTMMAQGGGRPPVQRPGGSTSTMEARIGQNGEVSGVGIPEGTMAPSPVKPPGSTRRTPLMSDIANDPERVKAAKARSLSTQDQIAASQDVVESNANKSFAAQREAANARMTQDTLGSLKSMPEGDRNAAIQDGQVFRDTSSAKGAQVGVDGAAASLIAGTSTEKDMVGMSGDAKRRIGARVSGGGAMTKLPVKRPIGQSSARNSIAALRPSR